MTDPVHQRDMGLLHQSFVNGVNSQVSESLEALAQKREKHAWSWGKSLLVGLATIATGGVIGAIVIGVHASRAIRLENKYNELAKGALKLHKALVELRAAERQQADYEKVFMMGKERVKLSYSHERGAVMKFGGVPGQARQMFEKESIAIDPSRVMLNFETEVLRHPDAYGKAVVDQILSTYDAVINNPQGRNQEANQRNLQQLEEKAMQLKDEAAANLFGPRDPLDEEDALENAPVEAPHEHDGEANLEQAGRHLGQNAELTGMRVTLLREAKDRLRLLAKELLTTRLEMAPAECDFLEAGMSLEIMRKVLAGQMTTAEDVRAFVNRNASNRLFTTVESRAIYDQFEQAQAKEAAVVPPPAPQPAAQNEAPAQQPEAAENPQPAQPQEAAQDPNVIEPAVPNPAEAPQPLAGVQNPAEVKTDDVKFEANYRSVKENPALPPAEVQPVHDFVAELISSDYAAQHDRSFGADGHVNGTRLLGVMQQNAGVVGDLMENRAQLLAHQPVPDLLEHVDPKIKEKLNDLLDKLNARYQAEVADYDKNNGANLARQRLQEHEQKTIKLEPARIELFQKTLAQRDAKYGMGGASRAEFLKRELDTVQKRDAEMRENLGTDTIEDISDHDFAEVHNTEFARRNADLKALTDKDESLSQPESRQKIALSLDFFGHYEKEIDEAIGASMATVQGQLQDMINNAFGEVAENRSYSSREMTNLSLAQIIGNPGANGDMKLVREVLQHYFAEMPEMDKRSMVAAMTRYSKASANQGARLGALLKGAGPVMQKMLQGMDENLFQNPDFRAALADMRANLAPISQRAVQAYLFDLVKASKTTAQPINEIVVEKALGAASISQALKCTFKMADGTEKHCVVKMVRPEAEMRARREKAVFERAAQTVGAGMDRTFASRYESILAELDLRAEAENVKTGNTVYDYHRQSYKAENLKNKFETYGTFANVHSMQLAQGIEPTKSLLVLEEVPGMTLEKFNQTTSEESTRVKDEALRQAGENGNNADQIVADAALKLGRLYDEAREKYESVQNLTYMWVNEGLFAEGFYHGDVHKGNVMVQANWQKPAGDGVDPAYDGITLIDFGNATRLNAEEKKNVLQVVAGCAAGEAKIFTKGFEALLSPESREKFKSRANHDEIKAKVKAIMSKGTISDTAVRLAAILEVMQRDYQIEVPGAIHNFLESQRRLQTAMEESANLMKQIEADRKALLATRPMFAMQVNDPDDPLDLDFLAGADEGQIIGNGNGEPLDLDEEDELNAPEEEPLPNGVFMNAEAELSDKADAIELKTEQMREYRFRPMVKCIADVVMQNLFATMKAVGISSGSRCFTRIAGEMEALNQAQQPAIDAEGHVGGPAMVAV